MKETKVSVIVPVYNTEQYVKECLDSLHKQTLREIEIICVNDGSTDGSAAILEAYASMDERIRVITQENGGLSKARNVAMEQSKGKYICFVDSDDYLEEDALRELYVTAEEKDVDFINFDARCIYDSDRLREEDRKDYYYQRSEEFEGISSGKELFIKMMDAQAYCDAACLLFIKREWINQLGLRFYNGILHEDSLFTTLCFLCSKKMSYLNKSLYIYRVRENSIMTVKPNVRSIYGRYVSYRELLSYVREQEVEERVQKALCKYLDIIIVNARHVAYSLSEEERKNYEVIPPAELQHMDTLGLVQRSEVCGNEALYIQRLLGLVRENKKVILYGAGKVGNLTCRFLQSNDCGEHILSFAVTGEAQKDASLLNVPVACIDDLKDYAEDAYVLVTVRSNYQDEMVENAKKCGFKNIVVIEYLLENAMMKHFM